MKSLLSLCLVLTASFAFAGKPVITDINAALQKAKSENKMLFLQYGREACENCQALRGMIQKKQVSLSESKFVYADVNCDDSATAQAFRSKFKIVGNTLPFVIVAAPDGTQLAARSGYGSPSDFTQLIRTASKAASAATASAKP